MGVLTFTDVPLCFIPLGSYMVEGRPHKKDVLSMKRLLESVPLEGELHEGDGRIPRWLWLVVAGVALFATFAAPFQLFWTVGS